MLSRRTSAQGVVYYASPLLERIGVPHAFSTRVGGVSAPPFNSLNLGNPSEQSVQDDARHLATNYFRLQKAAGVEQRVRCFVHQVHGGVVLRAMREEFSCGQCADAIVTEDPTKVLAMRTADCVPVLLAAADGRAVAAIHAGWRGVINGIVPNAIEMLSSKNKSASLIAAIGPCIGFDAFEVGTEVLSEFARAFSNCSPVRRSSFDKGHVDLQRAVRLQLLAAGVGAESIDGNDRCTHRDADEFFSHRRDNGLTGRMASIIGAIQN